MPLLSEISSYLFLSYSFLVPASYFWESSKEKIISRLYKLVVNVIADENVSNIYQKT